MPEKKWVFTWWGSQEDDRVRAVDVGQIPPISGVPSCYFDSEAIMVHFSDLDEVDVDS